MTTLTLRQAQKLLAFFGGHDCEVTIISHTKLMETMPATQPGLYAYCTEYPEEGCEYLGPTEVDDELATKGMPPDAKAERERFEAAYAAIPPITPTKETAWRIWNMARAYSLTAAAGVKEVPRG